MVVGVGGIRGEVYRVDVEAMGEFEHDVQRLVEQESQGRCCS
ncbi:hypothetical protein [Streptomyces cucumeris]|nr:hypothetical protein [Streptomyces sp. NEAU-Y11]